MHKLEDFGCLSADVNMVDVLHDKSGRLFAESAVQWSHSLDGKFGLDSDLDGPCLEPNALSVFPQSAFIPAYILSSTISSNAPINE